MGATYYHVKLDYGREALLCQACYDEITQEGERYPPAVLTDPREFFALLNNTPYPRSCSGWADRSKSRYPEAIFPIAALVAGGT